MGFMATESDPSALDPVPLAAKLEALQRTRGEVNGSTAKWGLVWIGPERPDDEA
jgi:hypothetical protein